MSSVKVTRSSGNVFADLGFADAEETRTKAELTHAIAQTLERRSLTQKAAAVVLGIDQPKVSKLLRGHFSEYSVERLMRFLTRLGYDVEINVKRGKARHQGHVHVVAA